MMDLRLLWHMVPLSSEGGILQFILVSCKSSEFVIINWSAFILSFFTLAGLQTVTGAIPQVCACNIQNALCLQHYSITYYINASVYFVHPANCQYFE